MTGAADRTGPSRSRRSLPPVVERVALWLRYVLIAIGLFVLAGPVLVIVLISFNPTSQEAFPPTGFSLRWYGEFFQSPQFVESFFVVSLPIALLTAVIATTVGTVTAYALVRYDYSYRNVIQTLLTTPIMIPGIIIGLALLIFFSRVGFGNEFVNLAIGHSVRTFPYALLTTMTALAGFDREVELAARNLGANRFQMFRKVTLPLMQNGVVAGFLLTFIVSFADINIALFLSGGNAVTLPVQIYSFLLYESSPIIAAISTLQILLVLVLVLVISYLVNLETVMAER